MIFSFEYNIKLLLKLVHNLYSLLVFFRLFLLLETSPEHFQKLV